MAETTKEEKEKEPEVPAHVQTFDPEKPPFEIQRLCTYLRELEAEKEHK